MDIISSNSNKYVRLLKSLSDKKSRDESGLFLAEGERLIKDMPSDFSAEFYLVAQNKLDEFSYLTAGKKFFAATESVIKYACNTVTPSGIVAAVVPGAIVKGKVKRFASRQSSGQRKRGYDNKDGGILRI